MTKDIVSGFIEIAEKGFLHRDLKLANIFLSKGKAIIADFGFAKKHRYIVVAIPEASSRNRSTMSAVPYTCHLKPSKRTSTP